MDTSIVNTNGELQALHLLPFILGHPRDIILLSLGELSTAPDMFQQLHFLTTARQWSCPQLEVLRGYSWLAGWLVRLRDDVLEPLLPAHIPNPVLHGQQSLVPVITRIMHEAIQLSHAKKDIGFRPKPLGLQLNSLSDVIFDLAGKVLVGGMTVAQFQMHIPRLIASINQLLLARMAF